MKKFIAGLIVGILLSTSFVYAAQNLTAVKTSYKIFVNGKQFVSSDKPPVTINGSTYLPLRAMGNALGVRVNWNSALKQVEIGDMSPTSSQTSTINTGNLEISFSGYSFFPGYRIFDVEFKNTGTTEISFNPTDLKCDGKPGSNNFSIEDKPMLQPSKLVPGASAKGKVAFVWDGDANKTVFTLSYKDAYNTTYTKK